MSSIKRRLKAIDQTMTSLRYGSASSGISIPKAVLSYPRAKKNFDMSMWTYLRTGLCFREPFSEEEAAKAKKELKRLGDLVGKSPEQVLKMMGTAHVKTNISFEQYCKKDCVLKNELRTLLVAAQKPFQEVLDIYCEVIMNRTGVSYEEALARLHHIKKKFDLSYLQVMNGCYYKMTDEQIAAALAAIPRRYDTWVDKYAAQTGKREDVESARAELNKVGEKYGITAAEVVKRGYNEKSEKEIQKNLSKRDADELKKLRALAKECNMTVWEYKTHELYQRGKFGEAHSHYRKLKHYLRTDEEYETFIKNSDKQYFMHKYNATMEGIQILLDKGEFFEYFSEEAGRHYWRNTPGATFESFSDFVTNYGGTKMFVKAAKSSQGMGVECVDPTGRDLREMYDEYMSREKLVIDECLIQHPDVAKFGGGCVNTLRTVTIFDKGEAHIIYCYIRIGAGAVFDNVSQGGIKALIDLEKGEIVSLGYTNAGTEEENDPATGNKLMGSRIPYCEEIKDLVKRAARRASEAGVGFVGWDVALTVNGPVLVEGNDNPALNGIEYIGLDLKKGHRHILKPFLDEVE